MKHGLWGLEKIFRRLKLHHSSLNGVWDYAWPEVEDDCCLEIVMLSPDPLQWSGRYPSQCSVGGRSWSQCSRWTPLWENVWFLTKESKIVSDQCHLRYYMLSNFEMGPPYSLLNQSICIKVHSCCCLVQNKNLCFPQEGPGGNILDVLSQGSRVILILTKFGILISTLFQIVPFGLWFSKQFLFLMYDPSFCCL